MLHESTRELIRKLYELTAAGNLAWKEGERESSRLATEGYVIEVEPAPAALRLLQADGRVLERADAGQLEAVAWPGGEGNYATRVSEMASRAHRVSRGAERAIATVLTALSAPPKPLAPKPALTASFGRTQSFARPAPPPAPHPAPPPVTPTPELRIQGFSARSVQTVAPAAPIDLQRALAPQKPAPRPSERGADIYKPWA